VESEEKETFRTRRAKLVMQVALPIDIDEAMQPDNAIVEAATYKLKELVGDYSHCFYGAPYIKVVELYGNDITELGLAYTPSDLEIHRFDPGNEARNYTLKFLEELQDRIYTVRKELKDMFPQGFQDSDTEWEFENVLWKLEIMVDRLDDHYSNRNNHMYYFDKEYLDEFEQDVRTLRNNPVYQRASSDNINLNRVVWESAMVLSEFRLFDSMGYDTLKRAIAEEKEEERLEQMQKDAEAYIKTL
jgi:hypothetical protein